MPSLLANWFKAFHCKPNSKTQRLFLCCSALLLLATSSSIAEITQGQTAAKAKLIPLTSTLPNAAVVGTIKGEFQVGATGAATYSMQIAVPPGTADIAPLLSISYSSQQGNGLLGMGFGLSGLTAITRCSSNLSQNSVIHGVDYRASSGSSLYT
jgi:hypothetical protein